MVDEKLKIAAQKKPSERTEIEHLALIKHVHNGSVRDYLLTMGAFKDIPVVQLPECRGKSEIIKEDKTMEESVQKVVHENPDSIELGTPSKGGAVKVYGDFNKPDEFMKKIDNAAEVRKYAEANINIAPK